MEEEEARLKALLDQTSDFDERKKIRAELRAVRMKKLDAINDTVSAESSERAARRAERARARRAEQMNGDASTTEKESGQAEVMVTDQMLVEMEDEEALQKLLNELPTSQFDDRRKVRARIREVKRKNAEGETTGRSTYSQRREVTVTSEEPASVTVETTVETRETITNHSGGDEEVNFQVTVQESTEIRTELTNGDISGRPIEAAADEADENQAAAISEDTREREVEVVVEDEQKEVESKERQIEEPEPEVQEQEVQEPEEQRPEDEELPPPPEPEENERREEEEEKIDDEVPADVPATVEEVNANDAVEAEKEPNVEKLSFDKDSEVCLEVKIDDKLKMNCKANEDVNVDTHEIKDNSDDTKPAENHEATDGRKPSLKDSSADAKPALKNTRGSRWPPPENDKKDKIGKINTTDFRSNLKRSGKIGAGVVNLEKNNSTTGAQVDFRGDHLKKSGRIGKGAVNLENKIVTAGAQVDFRSNLKHGGKGSVKVKLPGVKPQQDHKDKADVEVTLKSGIGNGDPDKVSDASKIAAKTPEPQPERDAPILESAPKEEKVEDVQAPKEEEKKEDVQAPKEEKRDVQPVLKVGKKEEVKLGPKSWRKEFVKPAPKTEKKEDVKPVPKTEKKEDVKPAPETEKKEDIQPPPKEDKTEDEEKKEDVAASIQVEVAIEKPPSSAPKAGEKKFQPSSAKPPPGKLSRSTKLFENLANARNKDTRTPPPSKTRVSPFLNRSSRKSEPTPEPADKGVNGVTVQIKNTTLATKEESTPDVQIQVSEHVEEEGETTTEVREVNTTKDDGDTVEERKEVTKVSKTTAPGGGQITTETKTTTKMTTRKGFSDPELQKRLAARQRERVAAKREQASSAKNKRMAFMQKLEANSPKSTAPTQVKRSASNVDKLLAWCRFKTRDYEGIKLNNFSSSWADGLAFCAVLHLYLPDKIPYDELLKGGDKRRNFEVAFGAATEAGVPELLEIDDMLSVTNPEPKSVMTYVSSIYKHFNPS